jgi:hypothetical protein
MGEVGCGKDLAEEGGVTEWKWSESHELGIAAREGWKNRS